MIHSLCPCSHAGWNIDRDHAGVKGQSHRIEPNTSPTKSIHSASGSHGSEEVKRDGRVELARFENLQPPVRIFFRSSGTKLSWTGPRPALVGRNDLCVQVMFPYPAMEEHM